MSMVVTITLSQSRRDILISSRNGFTYASNLFTLIVAITFILTVNSGIWTFRLLAYTLTFIGLFTSFMFIFFVPEIQLSKDAIIYDKAYKKANGEKAMLESAVPELEQNNTDKDEAKKSTTEEVKTWRYWLTDGAFYVHAAVYTLARMAVNVTMTLTPFYLIHVLGFEGEEGRPTPPQIVTVPLVSYSFSMVFSLLFYRRLLNKFGNRMIPLLIGVIITCCSSLPFLFLRPSISWLVYIAASFQGIGLAILLNIATSLISDVIGDDDNSSAFVYGAYSLCDKFFSGALLVIIGNTVIEDKSWLIWLSSGLPIIAALGTYLFAFMGQHFYSHKMRGVSVQK